MCWVTADKIVARRVYLTYAVNLMSSKNVAVLLQSHYSNYYGTFLQMRWTRLKF